MDQNNSSVPFVICCAAMDTPFCASTARPHRRCSYCSFVFASLAICPCTGNPHFDVPTKTCRDCSTVFVDPPHVMFCTRTGVRHTGPSPARRSPTPPSPTYSEDFMARVQRNHHNDEIAMRNKRAREEETMNASAQVGFLVKVYPPTHPDPIPTEDQEIYYFAEETSDDETEL